MRERTLGIPPVTWVDVARRFVGLSHRGGGGLQGDLVPPKAVVEVEVFWSGLTILLNDPEGKEAAITWLKKLLPDRIEQAPDGEVEIKLDAPKNQERLSVVFEQELSEARSVQKMYRPTASLRGKYAFDVQMPDRPQSAVPVFAFHSVKGGVGRTTTAIAVASHLATSGQKKPVLLVDADFEAPGLSYLYSSRRPESSISFEDFLVLIHGDTSEDLSDSLDFVANKLSEQRVDNLYVLPATRSSSALSAFAVRPEHLVSARKGQPFIIVDALRQIADRLDCSAVVLDLRAGLVEIAMQVLCDPSVECGFVTTTSGQSVEATCDMLRAVGDAYQITGSAQRKSVLILNQVPAYLSADRRSLDEVTGKIERAAVEAFNATAEQSPASGSDDADVEFDGDSPLTFVEMLHYTDMVCTPNTWESFITLLNSTGFAKSLAEKLTSWPAFDILRSGEVLSPPSYVGSITSSDRLKEARNTLAEAAKNLIFAENAPDNMLRPLVIPPLRRLAGDFLKQPPIAVVEGAKGTGKTMLARFLLQEATWQSTIKGGALGQGLSPDIVGSIVPVFMSSQGGQIVSTVSSRLASWATEFSGGTPLPVSQVKRAIEDRLSLDLTDGEWSDFWLDAIAWVSGIRPGESGAWEEFVSKAKLDRSQPIALFEGLEEVISDPYSNPTQSAALRSLITTVPLRLRELTGRPIGLIVFVRGDMVEAVIPQNLPQFRAAYRNYALTWSTTDILELVAWIVDRSGAIPNFWAPNWRDARTAQTLEPVWGLKLGSQKSREARSTEWVLAVLTDLNGRLTARDLVTFIAEAARLSIGEASSEDDFRLLTPASMRRAVAETSESKVKTYPNEVTVLKDVFEKLKNQKGLETPLDKNAALKVGLTPEDLGNLVKYGVFFEEDGSYEVPELFRIGLRLGRKGARPNIISLTRRALEKAQPN